MDRLLDRFNLRSNGDQLSLNQPGKELVAEAVEIQTRRVAYVDKSLAATSGESP